MSGHGSAVYFGLSPMWVSTVILAATYIIIMSEKINRAIIALIGASVMILVGVFTQEEAIKGIDWNTIGLLTGMMILVSISRRSGMFEYIAIWSAQAARAHPAGILFKGSGFYITDYAKKSGGGSSPGTNGDSSKDIGKDSEKSESKGEGTSKSEEKSKSDDKPKSEKKKAEKK